MRLAREETSAMKCGIGKLAVALCLLPSLLAAQSSEGPSLVDRLIEIPAHERLQAVRDDPNNGLAPFTTDGCSGGMSAAWEIVAQQFPQFEEVHAEHPPWESCCIKHDQAYHLGGEDSDPEASFAARLAADDSLAACVEEHAEGRTEALAEEYGMTPAQVAAAYHLIARAMYASVRLGGGPCTALPWRWGYGWPDCSWLAE
jgi:hypothetical protein